MFREPELNKAYHDLLTHKNPDIQKAALDCIMTYKYKYLVPYKDHLYGLIDDKTFKDEVTLFRIDTDNDLIRPEHRAELIPVVLRIVYSKMLNRSGVRTGSKSAKQVRRSIVFRFLAGCKHEELLFYLHMAFRLYTPTVQENVGAMVSHIQDSLNLSCMTPPKRLLSTAKLLAVVLTQCGSLLSHDALQFLLRVLLSVGATVATVLSRRDDVHAGYLGILRNIRTAAINVMTNFFSAFENFPWTAAELDAVFEVFVWPYLSKLPDEGVYSPTALLKLIMAWTQIPRQLKRSQTECTSRANGDPKGGICSFFSWQEEHLNNCIVSNGMHSEVEYSCCWQASFVVISKYRKKWKLLVYQHVLIKVDMRSNLVIRIVFPKYKG
ncbi:U3 snoRNP protein [Homalodisca vitripennis]|nr:U3 snoRNP protein [Homalodisca vitripennis]